MCEKCGSKSIECPCPKPIYVSCDECDPKVDAKCVVLKDCKKYKAIGSPRDLKEALANIDDLFDKNQKIVLSECSKKILGLPSTASANIVLSKVLDYLCDTVESGRVAVNANDCKPGFLIDKITVGSCLKKEVRKDIDCGSETVHISIDYDCLKQYLTLGEGVTISTASYTVCGENKVTLNIDQSILSTQSIIWSNGFTSNTITVGEGSYYVVKDGVKSNTITIVNTGNCPCDNPNWTNTDITRCVNNISETKQTNRCGDERWVQNGLNCTCQPVWVDVIPAVYECQNGFSVKKQIDGCGNTRWVAGGNACNTNCVWVTPANALTRCVSGVSEYQQIDGCGNTRWIAGGNGCNCTPTNVYTCQTNANDTGLNFTNSCGVIENKFTWGTPQLSCVNNTSTITVTTVEVDNKAYEGYTISYAIESIDNISQTPIYQSSGVFPNLLPSASYRFKTRITKGGATCYYAGIIETNCTTTGNICNEEQTATHIGNYQANTCASGCTSNNVTVPTQTATINAGVFCRATLALANAAALAEAQSVANNKAQIYANANPNCSGCPTVPTVPTPIITQPNCDTATKGSVQFTGIVNGDRYNICQSNTFTCIANCNTPDGFITGGNATINFPTVTGVTAITYTIRVYNGINCSTYKDTVVVFNQSSCTGNCVGITTLVIN